MRGVTAPSIVLALLPAPPDPSTLGSPYGRLETDRASYRPPERIRVSVTGRARGDSTARLRAAEGRYGIVQLLAPRPLRPAPKPD